MFYVRLIIGETVGGNSCLQVLPREMNDPELGTMAEVFQCTVVSEDCGCSLLRISDPNGSLSNKLSSDECGECEFGKYNITRISNHLYTASVVNHSCRLIKLVSGHGCFVVSSVRDGENIIWTIAGRDSESVRELTRDLRDHGYDVERAASYFPEYTPTLTDKQDRALRLAFSKGYYDVPRKASIADLSREVSSSTSSFDVVLRTAERKVVSLYLQRSGGAAEGRK